MKVSVHIKYPYFATYEDDRVIEIPDGVDAEEYIYSNREGILEDTGYDVGDLVLKGALDCGYADVILLEDQSCNHPAPVVAET